MNVKIVKIIFSSLLFFFIVAYGFYQGKTILSGPKVFIESPKDGSRIEQAKTPLIFYFKNTSRAELNGRALEISQEKEVREDLFLQKGLNLIQIKVWDQYGKKREKNIAVFRVG